MVFTDVNIHIISGIERFTTILAVVHESSGKMEILNMFGCTAPVTVNLRAERAADGPGSKLRNFLQIFTDRSVGV